MQLTNKVILIISQQDWGPMFISKHHYALELAKKGNCVYFLNGPHQGNKLKIGEINIKRIENPGLYIINHRFFFPYKFKFHFRFLYEKLVSVHSRRILLKIEKRIDIIWSFDISDTMPFENFSNESAYKIFMPVDLNLHPEAIENARKANLILSVSEQILYQFRDVPVPQYFINHGVADIFIKDEIDVKINIPKRVGLSGNFLIPALDRKSLIEIFASNKEIIFELWGAIDSNSTNITSPLDDTDDARAFIEGIKKLNNVIIHGQTTTPELAKGLKRMDAFLIAYKTDSDSNEVTNSHKILEYLGNGKVIISNKIATYQNRPELIQMVSEKNRTDNLVSLFKNVTSNLEYHNNSDFQRIRIRYATEHIYSKQIDNICKLIGQNSLENKNSW